MSDKLYTIDRRDRHGVWFYEPMEAKQGDPAAVPIPDQVIRSWDYHLLSMKLISNVLAEYYRQQEGRKAAVGEELFTGEPGKEQNSAASDAERAHLATQIALGKLLSSPES